MTLPTMSQDFVPEEKRYNNNKIVAKWCVPINGKMYRIELEHGHTSGRRMIWVNGKEVLRRDWMFKLVGEDTFQIGDSQCVIRVDPAPGFKYEYSLYIDSKSYEQYTEDHTKQYRLWMAKVNEVEYRVSLELNSLNLYINDQLREEQGEFVDGGTDTRCLVDNVQFVLQARSSGNKLDGIVHSLVVNGETIPEAKIQEVMQEHHSSILSSTT